MQKFKFKKKYIKPLFFGILIAFIILLFLLYGKQLVSTITIVLLIILGCISKAYKHFTGISIGFELVTFATIVFAYKVGFFFALIACIIMLVVSEFLSAKINMYSILFQVVIYLFVIVIAYAASFSSVPFIPIAIGLIIFRNILLFISMTFFGGIDIFRTLIATIPNIFINIFLVVKFFEIISSVV